MVKTAPSLPANRLPGLSAIIKERGATNMVEASIPAVARCIEAMQTDPILCGFPLHEVSFAEVVFRVIKKGKPLERAAMAKLLTPDAAFFFPSASRFNYKVVIDDVLKPMFVLLCEHFGVQFAGNMDMVAYSILTEFGGLSFADFLICFERVKNGRYRKDTQHIMTRGINAEFIGEWLRQYDEEREEHRAAAYAQYRPDNIPMSGGSPELSAKIAEYNADKKRQSQIRQEIVRVADAAFAEWENDLYTAGVFKQGFKVVTREVDDLDQYGDKQYRHDGTVLTKKVKEETLCPADDPAATRFDEYVIRVPKPGAMERKVKRIIYEFIVAGDRAEMESYFDEFIDRVRAKYSGEPDAEGHVEAELKIVLSGFATIKRRVTATKMVESVFRKLHPDAEQSQITTSARGVIEMFEATYFDQYLPDCVRTKYPRLDRKEFLIVAAMPEYLKAGFYNPFKALFA